MTGAIIVNIEHLEKDYTWFERITRKQMKKEYPDIKYNRKGKTYIVDDRK